MADKDEKNLHEEEGYISSNETEIKNNEDEGGEQQILDVPEEEVEKSNEDILQEEVEQLRDEKLRLLAEMENLRKRADREKIDSIKYGSSNFARDILSPDDNLTRALDAIPSEEKNTKTITNLIDGLKMVQKEFATILEKHGVKKIDSINEKFDHNLHQAMVELENEEVEPGTVIQELQKGYTMHERLLRPSMVAVSKKSNKEREDKEKQ